jgi:subtilisin family serine protease
VLAVGGVNEEGLGLQAVAGTRVDVVAPAVDAVSVAPTGNGHYSVGGSAVAAAYVAGTAALVRAYHPELGPGEVADRIEHTAEAPSSGRGSGPIDPYSAVTEVDPAAVVAKGPADPAKLAVPVPPPADPARRAALRYAGGAALGAVAVLLLVAVLRSGRRRGWRP